MVQPNGLAFSCRERAAEHLQKTNDLAREAVSCNAVFGGHAEDLRLLHARFRRAAMILYSLKTIQTGRAVVVPD
jgi:hypothetical protein